jgi:hypothetical protein
MINLTAGAWATSTPHAGGSRQRAGSGACCSTRCAMVGVRHLDRAGEPDQVTFWVVEVADEEVCAQVLLGAHPARPAEAFGLLQCGLDVGHPDVKDCMALVAAPAADAARDPEERWALLVVRELLLGPQRFSDLLPCRAIALNWREPVLALPGRADGQDLALRLYDYGVG